MIALKPAFENSEGRRIAAVALVGIACVVAYVLSCGPMFAVYTNGYISIETYSQIYYPLLLLVRREGPLLDAFNWYVNRWDSWLGPD